MGDAFRRASASHFLFPSFSFWSRALKGKTKAIFKYDLHFWPNQKRVWIKTSKTLAPTLCLAPCPMSEKYFIISSSWQRLSIWHCPRFSDEKSGLREVKSLARSHTASKCESWKIDTGILDLKAWVCSPSSRHFIDSQNLWVRRGLGGHLDKPSKSCNNPFRTVLYNCKYKCAWNQKLKLRKK